jgi:hypothetical protein
MPIGCGGIANAPAQRLAGLCDRATERADAFGTCVI